MLISGLHQLPPAPREGDPDSASLGGLALAHPDRDDGVRGEGVGRAGPQISDRPGGDLPEISEVYIYIFRFGSDGFP